jgi:RecA/RadA recombinase
MARRLRKNHHALHIIASAQKEGGTAAFIDVEHALDLNIVKNLVLKQMIFIYLSRIQEKKP